MKTEALFLFLILLFGLVICYILGDCNKENMTNQNSSTSYNSSNMNYNTNQQNNSNYDNYNHYNQSYSQLKNGSTFYGPNGGTVNVATTKNGYQILKVQLTSNASEMIFTNEPTTDSSGSTTDASGSTTESYTNYYGENGEATTFYGPNGSTATVIYDNYGNQAIRIQTSNGTYTFTQNAAYYNPNNTSTSTQYYGSVGYPIQSADSTTTYYGANGGTATTATGSQGNTAYYVQGPNGNTAAGTTANDPYYNPYYGPYGGSAGAVTGPQGNSAYYVQGPYGNTVAGTTANDPYYNPYYGANAGAVTGPQGNSAYYVQGPYGNTVAGTTANNSAYYNSLPYGIPGNQIPPGQEDLYILKSQVVPPVCPACPTSSACPREEPCPACPACARCPEPAFECKKVPNYNAIDNDYLPAPVLNDFSTFGM